MALLIIGEMIYSHYHNRQLYTVGDTFINLVCTTWNFVNDILFRAVALAILFWFSQYSVFNFSEKTLFYWILLFFAQDLAYYFLHVADHYVRFFWATHSTHHSSEKFNFSVAIRSSVFQPFYRFLFYIPLTLIGFEAIDIVFMYAACQIYGFWVHTELVGKLHPALEFIFVTPSHHRVHHASNDIYLDTNMGMVLIIWDRIFGTFQEELAHEQVRYGLSSNVNTYHPIKVVFFEWRAILLDIRKANSFREVLGYLFGPPGWSADGSRKTSSQIKSEMKLSKRSLKDNLAHNLTFK